MTLLDKGLIKQSDLNPCPAEGIDIEHSLLFSSQFQTFRFMVGPGDCPMISKYGLSLSKTGGSADPSFLVVKKSHFNKNIHFTACLQTPQNRKYM